MTLSVRNYFFDPLSWQAGYADCNPNSTPQILLGGVISRLETAPLAVFLFAQIVKECAKTAFHCSHLAFQLAYLSLSYGTLGLIEGPEGDDITHTIEKGLDSTWKAAGFTITTPMLLPLSLIAPDLCPEVTEVFGLYTPKKPLFEDRFFRRPIPCSVPRPAPPVVVHERPPIAEPTPYDVQERPTIAEPTPYDVPERPPIAEPTPYDVQERPTIAEPTPYDVPERPPTVETFSDHLSTVISCPPAEIPPPLREVMDPHEAAPILLNRFFHGMRELRESFGVEVLAPFESSTPPVEISSKLDQFKELVEVEVLQALVDSVKVDTSSTRAVIDVLVDSKAIEGQLLDVMKLLQKFSDAELDDILSQHSLGTLVRSVSADWVLVLSHLSHSTRIQALTNLGRYELDYNEVMTFCRSCFDRFLVNRLSQAAQRLLTFHDDDLALVTGQTTDEAYRQINNRYRVYDDHVRSAMSTVRVSTPVYEVASKKVQVNQQGFVQKAKEAGEVAFSPVMTHSEFIQLVDRIQARLTDRHQEYTADSQLPSPEDLLSSLKRNANLKLWIDWTGKEGEVPPKETLQLHAILKYFSECRDWIEEKELVTPLEQGVFGLSYLIQKCVTGQKGGVEDFYATMPVEYQTEQVEMDILEKMKLFVDSILQRTLHLQSGSRKFVEGVVGVENLEEFAHSELFMRNRLAPHIGLKQPVTFDYWSSYVEGRLLEMSVAQAVEAFYNHLTPETLLSQVKRQLDTLLENERGNAFITTSIERLLGTRSLHEIFDYDTVDLDEGGWKTVFSTKEEVVLELLVKLGYLKYSD